MASGATGSVIVRGGRGKTRGEGGKKGRKAGRRGRGSKMIVNMGGGRVGVYFKNKRKGGREGGEAE